MQMFTIQGNAEPYAKSMRGLNLVAVRLTTSLSD